MANGAGHIQDMINRMRQNRASRPSNRSRFKENNREAIYEKTPFQEKPNFKEVSPKTFLRVNSQFREKAAKERKEIYFSSYTLPKTVCLPSNQSVAI